MKRMRRCCLPIVCVALALSGCGDDSATAKDAATDGDVSHDGINDSPQASCPKSCVVYVDKAGSLGDGKTPASPLHDVQQGIEEAYLSGRGVCTCEVHVAQGRYFIHQTSRDDTITLRAKVELRGGYPAGFGGAANPAQYETILDGRKAGGLALSRCGGIRERRGRERCRWPDG